MSWSKYQVATLVQSACATQFQGVAFFLVWLTPAHAEDLSECVGGAGVQAEPSVQTFPTPPPERSTYTFQTHSNVRRAHRRTLLWKLIETMRTRRAVDGSSASCALSEARALNEASSSPGLVK